MMRRHLMTCAQFVDLADAFALEALDELEHRACARHIGRMVAHHGCREALAQAHGVMDWLATAVPGRLEAPSAGLWDAIAARLGAGTSSSNAEWL
jgi:hypothetical protein